MTKHDWIWIAIRVFGIYLLVQAVVAIPSVLSSAVFLYQSYPIIHSGDPNMDKLSQTLRVGTGNHLVDALGQLFVYGAVGIYLVKGGSCLFKILCPPDSESK